MTLRGKSVLREAAEHSEMKVDNSDLAGEWEPLPNRMFIQMVELLFEHGARIHVDELVPLIEAVGVWQHEVLACL